MPIQPTGKKKRGLNGSIEIKAEANFSDIAFFSLWFNLINFCLSGIGVTINPKKIDDQNTGAIVADKSDTSRANLLEADKAEADRADVKKAHKFSMGKLDPAEANGTETDRAEVDQVDADRIEADGTKANGAKVDAAEEDIANKPDISPTDPANLAKADGADEWGTGIADLVEADLAKANRAKEDRADKWDIGPRAEDWQKQLAEKQVAARASFFSFYKVAYFFFSFLELEIPGSSAMSWTLSSVITFIKQDTPSFK